MSWSEASWKQWNKKAYSNAFRNWSRKRRKLNWSGQYVLRYCSTPYLRKLFHSFVWQFHQKSQLIRYRISIGLSTSARLHGDLVDLQSLIMWYAVWGSPHWHRLPSTNSRFTIESPNSPIPVSSLFNSTQAFRGRPCLGGLFDQSWMCGCSLCDIGSCWGS